MVVFELPATQDGGALRAVSLGSCRVRNPMFVLRDRGALRILAEGPTPTHTAEEAAQSLAIFTGEITVPEELNKFIFENDHRPIQERLGRALSQNADVYLLEISDDKQFSYGNFLLNQNFVSRHFVQPYRGALLEWYREISRGQPASATTIESAMGKLRDGGFRHDDQMVELLRGIRLDRRDGEQIAASLEALSTKMGGQWIIVGPFAVPGDKSDVMVRRRAFNKSLRAAANHCGATFFNPTRLIKTHGKADVLAAGVSIYEYEESFYPTLGEALIEKIRAVGAQADSGVSKTNAGTPLSTLPLPEITRSRSAIWLEAKAIRAIKMLRRLYRKAGLGIAKLLPRARADM